MSAPTTTADEQLSKGDRLIIRQVYHAYAEFGMPFLLSPKWWKRADALAKRGLLKAAGLKIMPPSPGCDGYLPTDAGIDAYNAALGEAP